MPPGRGVTPPYTPNCTPCRLYGGMDHISGEDTMSMETERRHAQDLADMLAPLGEVGVTRFFSGAGLTLAGRQFAFVIDGTLYLRTDAEGRAAFEALGAGPFSYDGPSRQVIVRALSLIHI